jgi:hypothetical protein
MLNSRHRESFFFENMQEHWNRCFSAMRKTAMMKKHHVHAAKEYDV